jgi:hypothetical protein
MRRATRIEIWQRVALVAALGVAFGLGLAGAAGQTEPAVADPEAVALLERAAETMGEVSSFHFVLRNERGSTSIVEGLEVESFEGDVQRPDRFQAEVTASFGGVPLEVRIVGIGTRIWISSPLTGENIYQELPAEAATLGLNPDGLLRTAIGVIQEPRIVGEDEVDGEPTTLVAGLVDFQALAEATPTALDAPPAEDLPSEPLPVQIWIDEADRVVRLRLEGPLTPVDPDNVVRRLDLSAFDEPVEIEPPTT